jgi:hypothetical protein
MQTHIGRYHSLQGVDFDAPRGMTTLLLGRDAIAKTCPRATSRVLASVMSPSGESQDEAVRRNR